MKKRLALVCVLALSACEVTTTQPAQSGPTTAPATRADSGSRVSAAAFRQVIRTVEPVAERECRRRASDLNCDFKIVIDENPKQPPNAFQTLDENGRPIIGFTIALINDARNTDELAFVMGHETAHHISRHLERQRQSALTGAVLGSIGDALLGVETGILQQIGGTVGARVYSKDNELEADALGTVITKRAGYNPVRGAEFFTRIPDPGDRFLGTHPPNSQRIETVRRVNSQL